MSEELKTDLATTGGTPSDLAPNDLLGDGFEDIDAGDVQIPFLKLLQSGSPEVKKKGSDYVEGAEEGMIYDAGSGELIDGDEGLLVVPAFIDKATIEWEQRDDSGGGGGFVARHPWDHPEIEAQQRQGVPPNKWVSAAGNKLSQTYYLWCVAVNPEDATDPGRFVIVSFSSTNINSFKKWMSKARQATEMVGGQRRQVFLWRMLLRLRTKYSQNAKGEFFNWMVDFANTETGATCGWKDAILSPTDARVESATLFRQSIAAGSVKAEQPTEGTVSRDENLDEDGNPF